MELLQILNLFIKFDESKNSIATMSDKEFRLFRAIISIHSHKNKQNYD